MYAQSVLNLSAPGSMVPLSEPYFPATILGINIHVDDPLKFDFIISKGNSGLEGESFEKESEKLVRYFLASLTIPESEMWVNLSPYEKARIIPDSFGQTEMGRDLLALDYVLKQVSATLMHPDNDFGKEFWARVYSKIQEKFGTSEIPVNTFNKIWIVPDEATIHEHERGALIVDAHLKVMLEEDYLALEANKNSVEHGLGNITEEKLHQLSTLSEQVYREVILPEIEKEVNEGRAFAQLRQIYNSMLLASWYKNSLKESLLGKVYVNQYKTKGVDIEDKGVNEKIYQRYVEAFRRGTHDFIKEEYDPVSQQIIPRKYFSGGIKFQAVQDFAQLSDRDASSPLKNMAIAGALFVSVVLIFVGGVKYSPPVRNATINAMVTEKDFYSVTYMDEHSFSNLSELEHRFQTEVDEMVDIAIAEKWHARRIKEGILTLWQDYPGFRNQFEAINASVPKEGVKQDDALVRAFYFSFGRYILHYTLNQLGITNSDLQEEFEAQFKIDFGIGYTLHDAIGGKTIEAYAPAKILMPIRAANIHSEIFSPISHEIIHWLEEIANEPLIGLGNSRQALRNISFGKDLDKRWLLANSLGEFNYLAMEDRFYEKSYHGESYALGLSEEQVDADIKIERGETPFTTHAKIRSPRLSFEINYMQKHNRSSKPMDTWQDVVAFIEEEYPSDQEFYKEGVRFGFYAMSQYGAVGDFLLRLYGAYYDQMNFAQMELATTLLHDILNIHDLLVPKSEIEDLLRKEAIETKLNFKATYQELAVVAESLRDKIVSDFIKQGIISNKKSTVSQPFNSSVKIKKQVGGIDFNPAMADIKKEGRGLIMPAIEIFDQNMTIEGIAPVVINVSPFTESYLTRQK